MTSQLTSAPCISAVVANRETWGAERKLPREHGSGGASSSRSTRIVRSLPRGAIFVGPFSMRVRRSMRLDSEGRSRENIGPKCLPLRSPCARVTRHIRVSAICSDHKAQANLIQVSAWTRIVLSKD
jgi:hypothetical protein